MKSKTLMILLAVCVVLAGIAYWVSQPERPSGADGKAVGTMLLEDLPVGDIRRVTIHGPEGETVLAKGEEFWTVDSRYGYPADFPKISDLVQKVAEMKVGRSFAATEEVRGRLALRPPDADAPEAETATRVAMGGAEKTLADLLLGQVRDTGGQYVQPAGGEMIYLVDREFRFLNQKPEQWLQTDLLNVPPDSIRKVVALRKGTGETVYVLARPEKGQPVVLQEVPQDRNVDQSKINNVINSLSSFRIDDVAPPDMADEEAGVDDTVCFAYHRFNGTVYTICPGDTVSEEDDRHYLTASVDYAPENDKAGAAETAGETPAEAAESSAVEETDAGAGETDTAATDTGTPEEMDAENAGEDTEVDPEKLRADAEAEHLKLSRWTYIVPKWRINRFETDPAAFLAPLEEETPEPSAAPGIPGEGIMNMPVPMPE